MDYHLSSSADSVRFNVLEQCIRGILGAIKPSESDRTKRLNAITQFGNCVRTRIPTVAAIEPFGSFVSNLFTKWGDLDVSIELHTPLGISSSRNIKRNTLRHIIRALQRSGLTGRVQFIPNARVPLLIFKSQTHDLSFDVSVDNYLGIAKSKILLWISQIDERFRDMVLLTKEWAKAQDINDPKSGTLNSYSLCLMVIFHFQTCEPPILPPLREIYHGNIPDDITGWTSISQRQIEDACAANIERFRSRNYRRNRSSLAQLLISFFRKYCDMEDFASEFAVCTYTGDWESIESNVRWSNKPHKLLIEDPFERPENAARAVGARELLQIADAFADAYDRLSSSTVLADHNSLLSILTRPMVGSQLGMRPQVHYSNSRRGSVVTEPVVREFGNLMIAERHPQSPTRRERSAAAAAHGQRGRIWRPTYHAR